MTDFSSYLTIITSLFIASWSVRALWYGYYQHFLPFLCAMFKAILELDWILGPVPHSELRHIANNWADIGLMLSFWSCATYGLTNRCQNLFHRWHHHVFMPYLQRPDLTPKKAIVNAEILEVVRNARKRIQDNAKYKNGR